MSELLFYQGPDSSSANPCFRKTKRTDLFCIPSCSAAALIEPLSTVEAGFHR
jgi:hypothetical protein